ncbi:hypothetical protein NEPAR06_0795 [Nematocida parisii]|uniref:Uncharacterized protein n=1 Tax=Nematocida parisii (strain ERTm3) TaxID=935791 RepID=I3EEI2_NEMP3|nr:uncharacterized protein NEPG_02256 [Nematocida parisii ERTm1]EIJ87629.1 hypothetical protein NEQG_02176 [Nematocida parisii ERTm3]KAI5128973.1 hypothetical protein NEPAR08_1407 [Nematocida parisii]EIJ92857.1 hypothetical protein NEPG_02256 [Nematocida parisii ERTm1]KAI5129153.1 hypothetical protein NEPAR03_1553 [Nematocida parisii]KAI5142052.1 hypothetical protein NEPAR04_1408 [Nematocida parisii]|eukprot:XP_013060083.1 hypothetical protein NEPG_02256 [Nematocida parisii ERTm1]
MHNMKYYRSILFQACRFNYYIAYRTSGFLASRVLNKNINRPGNAHFGLYKLWTRAT